MYLKHSLLYKVMNSIIFLFGLHFVKLFAQLICSVLFLFLSLSVAFADAAVAPIDFPIAPAFAVPKVSLSTCMFFGGECWHWKYWVSETCIPLPPCACLSGSGCSGAEEGRHRHVGDQRGLQRGRASQHQDVGHRPSKSQRQRGSCVIGTPHWVSSLVCMNYAACMCHRSGKPFTCQHFSLPRSIYSFVLLRLEDPWSWSQDSFQTFSLSAVDEVGLIIQHMAHML